MEIKNEWLDILNNEFEESKIPKIQLDTIKSKLRPLKLNKNEYLIMEGETPDKIAFVVSGLFRAFYTTPNAEEKTIVFRGKGRILSAYSSFVENENSKFSIQALEDSLILYTTILEFEKLMLEDKVWEIIKGRYFMNIFIEKETRERELLSNDAKTNYKKFLKKYPGLIDKINHYYIASYLGISNVTLSRIRKDI